LRGGQRGSSTCACQLLTSYLPAVCVGIVVVDVNLGYMHLSIIVKLT